MKNGYKKIESDEMGRMVPQKEYFQRERGREREREGGGRERERESKEEATWREMARNIEEQKRVLVL